MKIYIVNAASPFNGGKRMNYYVVGLDNALAEFDDCKKEGLTPVLFDTDIAPTGLIMRGDKICG